MRRATIFLSSFMLGIPNIISPPGRLSRSNTVTLWPRWFSWSATARPEGPEPTTATRLPLRTAGIRGVTQPFWKPFSMTASSLLFTVTLSPFNPQVQAASHRAGQTLPVNSGKLLVLVSRDRASRQLPFQISSFHSGIRLCSGQPLKHPPKLAPDWQKGTPQFMQRPACWVRSFSFR